MGPALYETDEHRALREQVRRFAREHIAPNAHAWDEAEEFPRDLYARAAEAGLLGISKVVSIKSKLFKKTRVMLLWDMLSYQQVPRTQPVVFRIGYTIK